MTISLTDPKIWKNNVGRPFNNFLKTLLLFWHDNCKFGGWWKKSEPGFEPKISLAEASYAMCCLLLQNFFLKFQKYL